MTDQTCDTCGNPATWLAYAAYDTVDSTAVHPLVARYPEPMARACSGHLVTRLWDDAVAGGATGAWLVRPCR